MGEDPPYAVDDNKIYIRSEAETGLAVRDEIVELVLRGGMKKRPEKETRERAHPEVAEAIPSAAASADTEQPPRTGVEVVSVDERSGVQYFTVRDLRNGNMVKNVTPKSARRLWHYAITCFAKLPPDLNHAGVQWLGNLGLINRQKQGESVRYDMVQRTPDGYRYYFGVTEDGIHGKWKQLVGQEDE